MLEQSFNPSTQEAEAVDLCTSDARLICIASWRRARAAQQRHTLSERREEQEEEERKRNRECDNFLSVSCYHC